MALRASTEYLVEILPRKLQVGIMRGAQCLHRQCFVLSLSAVGAHESRRHGKAARARASVGCM